MGSFTGVLLCVGIISFQISLTRHQINLKKGDLMSPD